MSFAARHPGTCGACDGPIKVNQQVRYTFDVLVHVTCPVDYPTCETCWLVHPPGECDR